MLHIHTGRQTDYLNNGTLYAPRYEEAFFFLLAKDASLIGYRGKRSKAASCLQQAVCVRKKKNEEKKKTRNKSRRTRNTPRNPQQPGDRDHLETACDETRPTR